MLRPYGTLWMKCNLHSTNILSLWDYREIMYLYKMINNPAFITGTTNITLSFQQSRLFFIINYTRIHFSIRGIVGGFNFENFIPVKFPYFR
jgi:hypothetical protein